MEKVQGLGSQGISLLLEHCVVITVTAARAAFFYIVRITVSL